MYCANSDRSAIWQLCPQSYVFSKNSCFTSEIRYQCLKNKNTTYCYFILIKESYFCIHLLKFCFTFNIKRIKDLILLKNVSSIFNIYIKCRCLCWQHWRLIVSILLRMCIIIFILSPSG